MSKNITIDGSSYTDVPYVDLPKTGGGTARFEDMDERFKKIATKNLGTISTSNTTATDTGQTLVVEGFDDYDLLVCICHTSPHTNGRHVSTVRLIEFAATSTSSTKTSATIATATEHYKLSSAGVLSCRAGTTPYGVYPYSATLSTSGGRKLTLAIYQRYNSTSTGTINGNYIMDVYGVKLEDLF